MARPPAIERQHPAAVLALLILGALLLIAGTCVAVLGGARPELLPPAARPPGVPLDTIGGAAVALGVAVALAGAGQVVIAIAARRGHRWLTALGAAGAAAMAVMLAGAAIATLVSGMPLAAIGLVAASGVYAWIAVVLAVGLHRSGGQSPR
jgi:hypothetical protein